MEDPFVPKDELPGVLGSSIEQFEQECMGPVLDERAISSETSQLHQQEQQLDIETPKTQEQSPSSTISTGEYSGPKLEIAADVNSLEKSLNQENSRLETSSPETNCSICLGKMENKSFTNSCFHQFCFTCLLEWSKVKAECPLCKQPFKSIVHNVRSMEDYDQYHLRFENPLNSWDNPDGRRFRYRSTMTSDRRRHHRSDFFHPLNMFSTPSRSYHLRSHAATTSDYRRYIYERNLWVRNLALRSSRYREADPTFYSDNPAVTHRLIPWLNRELNALQYGHQVAFLMELILSLILRFHIQSPEFEEHLRPYFLGNTRHFIHEFYNYARSPYDMVEYDTRAQYSESFPQWDPSHGSDTDVIVLSPTTNGDHHSTVNNVTLSTSSRPRWSLHLSRPTTSGDDLTSRRPEITDRARRFLERAGLANWNLTSSSISSVIVDPRSPQPGPSGHQEPLLVSSDDDDVDVTTVMRIKPEVKIEPVIPTEGEDLDDDCMVIAVGKPVANQHSVVVISDSEDDDQRLEAQIPDSPLPGPSYWQRSPLLSSLSSVSSASSSDLYSPSSSLLSKKRQRSRSDGRSDSRSSSHRPSGSKHHHHHRRHHRHQHSKKHSGKHKDKKSHKSNKRKHSHKHKTSKKRDGGSSHH